MGEYATDKRTGERFKIGTCESMYYVRFEQRKDFIYNYPTENCFWRIPTPDEDDVEMGNYNYELFKEKEGIPLHLLIDPYKFDKETILSMQEDKHTLQLRDERMGLLVNVKCPHGLPFKGEQFDVEHQQDSFVISYGYNGLRDTLYLAALKNTDKNLSVVVKCRCCHDMWSFSFPDIEPIMVSLWMKLRLLHQCSEYWYQHNSEQFNASVSSLSYHHKKLTITAYGAESWRVCEDGVIICIGDWKTCRDKFIWLLPRIVELNVPECWSMREPDYEDMQKAAQWSYRLCKRYLPDVDLKEKRE